MATKVVDTPTAEEFMRETLAVVDPGVLTDIADDLADKAAAFGARLTGDSPRPDDLLFVLRHVFSCRRDADRIMETVGPARLASEVDQLLHADEPVRSRFRRFQDVLVEFPKAAFELPSELLHFTYPDKYWLWTRWMWDPRPRTGSLTLVTEGWFETDDGPAEDHYIRVGEAVVFIRETGQSAGFTDFGSGLFGVDVFLAAVYAVYMYTVLRLRMTQEFNRLVPEHPELIRRLLGVHHMEV